MTKEPLDMRYEYFSWRGFFVGSIFIGTIMVIQSLVGFPGIWIEHAFIYPLFILFSATAVGIASGGVLVFLIPPDQDVIGLAGLGSEGVSQNLALLLVILSLVEPMIAGLVLFFSFYNTDAFIMIWVLLGFAAPSAGFAVAMYDRIGTITKDLQSYFSDNRCLDLSELSWIKGVQARTATYRMGMLESAVRRIDELRVSGHEIVRVREQMSYA